MSNNQLNDISKVYLSQVAEETPGEKIDRKSVNEEQDALYTSKDVCKILDVVPRTLDNYCATGQIEYIKTKKFRYFKQEFIDAFLSNKYKRLG